MFVNSALKLIAHYDDPKTILIIAPMQSLRWIVITIPRFPLAVMVSNFERFVVRQMNDTASNETAILCVHTRHADLVWLG